jgi:hypothetical protein
MSTLNPNSAVPPPQVHLERGYGASSNPRSYLVPATVAADFGSAPGNLIESSPLSQSVPPQTYGKFNEEWDASQRGSSIIDGPMQRSNSVMSQGDTLIPSRGGTLKKKASLRRAGSLKRSSSRRSSRAGSVRSLVLQPAGVTDETHSAFYSPVPTSGNPTEILANRFQGKTCFIPLSHCMTNLYLNYSLAQSPQRSHHIFPRDTNKLRSQSKESLEDF